MRRVLVSALVVLLLAAGAGWWAIGPTWRLFLSNPPTKTDVLFWTQGQRDSGFALVDKIPFVKKVPIAGAASPRPLPQGAPLEMGFDLGAYMQRQNSAGIVILHKGQLRFEAYGLNQTQGSRWTSFSVAKSITSTLVGVALAEGRIKSLDDKVSDYVAGLRGSAYDEVTVEQLLTMTSGVAWTEDYSDPASDVARFSEVEPAPGAPAIVTYLKALPRAHPPGEVFNYSTGETNLVGILVQSATGTPVNEYLSEKIWQPYGIGSGSWAVSGTGEPISGCCIQATTRDFARFGQFMLEGGLIDGTPVLPEGWVQAATARQKLTDRLADYDYGYQWWAREDGGYSAIGIFGQAIFIDPARDLVIATNSSWQDARGDAEGQADDRAALYDAVRAALDAEPG